MCYTFVPSLASAEMVVVIPLVPVVPIVIEILCGRQIILILVSIFHRIVPCIVWIFVCWGRLLCMSIPVRVREHTCGTDIGDDETENLCRDVCAEHSDQQLFPPCERLWWRGCFCIWIMIRHWMYISCHNKEWVCLEDDILQADPLCRSITVHDSSRSRRVSDLRTHRVMSVRSRRRSSNLHCRHSSTPCSDAAAVRIPRLRSHRRVPVRLWRG